MLCPSCGRENPEGFTFCGHCSALLEAETSVGQEVRKTVTVLFCDVTGSAEVHRLGGRMAEAADGLRRAIDTWDRKEAVFVAERLRARLEEVTAP